MTASRVLRWAVLALWLGGCVAEGGGSGADVAESTGPNHRIADASADADDHGADASTVADADSSAGGATVDGEAAPQDGATGASGDAGDVKPGATDATDAIDAIDAIDAGDTGDATSGGDFLVVVKTNSADGTQMLPLAAGAEMPLIYGPQGGYHVWTSVCVPMSVAVPAAMELSLRDAATGKPIAPSPVQLKSWLKDVVTFPGFRCHGALTLFVACPCAISGTPLIVRVEVTGKDGKVGWHETPVVAVHGAGPCEAPSTSACQTGP